MSVQLIPLQLDQVDKIVAIQDGVFLDGWSKKMLIDGLNSNLQGLVAIENGETLGFITYSITDDFSDLNDLFVAPNHRRKGVGKLLIDAYIEKIKSAGVIKSLLEVRKSNQTAITLYKKTGYNQIADRKKYYSDGETALVLAKELL